MSHNSSSSNRPTGESAPRRSRCPLCLLPDSQVLAEFDRWKLARTKTMKGHKERLMLLHKQHLKTVDEGSVGEAYLLLERIGSEYFSYTDKWAIFDPDFATVPDHWHRVASDLDENSEDYKQILKTPRMVIENHQGKITRIFVDQLHKN